MSDVTRIVMGMCMAGVALCSTARARAAEVSKIHSRGPSVSATFHRVTAVLCANGSLSAVDETVHVSAASFRDTFDGETIAGDFGFVTIFSLDGCTGVYSAGSADVTGLRYSQADVQRARVAGRAEVVNFITGEPMGVVVMDFVLEGVGPIATSVDHTKTSEHGNFRTVEVIRGKGRDSSFASGTITLNGSSLAQYFQSPIYSLLNGHYLSTTVTF